MVEVKVLLDGAISRRALDESRFGTRVLARTLKDAVVMYEANVRAGTAKSKSRGEVAGPNKKLWKQKHTGRARMGTKKSGLWRGGGTIFGPRPRDYSYRMPRVARRGALRNAIYAKLRDGELAMAEGWPSTRPSTSSAVKILKTLEMATSVLVVTDCANECLYLSLRNVPHVRVKPASELNARDVLKHRYLVVTELAFQALESRLVGKD